MNLTEAFKALDNLEEDVFSVNDEGIEKLQNFIKNDDSVDELNVYDLDVEDDTKKELDSCHVGDVILDCCVCHSKIFKPISEVVINNEKEVANEGEECPYCYSVDGYKVVGEVQPFDEDETEEVTISINDDVNTDLTEDIDEISVSTDDTEIKVSDEREGCEEEELEDEVAVESVKDKNHLTKKKILIKETRNRPELITKTGTIANVLASHMDELQNIYDVNELKNKVIELVDNSDIADTKGAKDFKYRVLSQRTVNRVLSTIGAYMSGISTRDKEESINRKSRKLGKYVVESDNKDETIGDKLRKYQMWVDYDIKHYGKVSKTTQDIIDKEGLQLIKDDHGDYEVSVGHYEAESYKKGCYFKEDIDEVNISSDDIDISIETKEKSCDDCKEETVFPTSEQTQQEIEINNVDKDTTEEVVEESLKENYSNVKFFKCNNVTCKGNNILVEGIIGFKSGKKRNTKFVFESYKTDGNTVSFIAKTNDLNRKNNNMFLNGKVIKNKFISESIKLR